MIVVLMGVSGSGKSTVGKLLARDLDWTFVEGDDYHSAASIEKMHQGIPLNDDDRGPWLARIRQRLEEAHQRGEKVILACSALKHTYQEYLAHYAPEAIRFVYLAGSEEQIRQRLAQRTGHFMNAALLHSQFEALEPPADAMRVDITAAPAAIAAEVRTRLGL